MIAFDNINKEVNILIENLLLRGIKFNADSTYKEQNILYLVTNSSFSSNISMTRELCTLGIEIPTELSSKLHLFLKFV